MNSDALHLLSNAEEELSEKQELEVLQIENETLRRRLQVKEIAGTMLTTLFLLVPLTLHLVNVGFRKRPLVCTNQLVSAERCKRTQMLTVLLHQVSA